LLTKILSTKPNIDTDFVRGHATARILQVSPVAEFLAVATTWWVPDFGAIAFEMLKEPSEMVTAFPLYTIDLLSITLTTQLTPLVCADMSTPKSMLKVPLSSRWTCRLLRLPFEHVPLTTAAGVVEA
jgi:hypothetical protein